MTWRFRPEKYTKRQATQQNCLPSLLVDGDKGIEIVYCEEKIFCSGPTRAAKAEQKCLVPARLAQRTNQGRTPFICTPWVPICLSFNCLVSLVATLALAVRFSKHSARSYPQLGYISSTTRLDLILWAHAVHVEISFAIWKIRNCSAIPTVCRNLHYTSKSRKTEPFQ